MRPLFWSVKLCSLPWFILCVFILLPFPLFSLPNPTLAAGYDQMYNLRFVEAHTAFQQYVHDRPLDPLGPVSDAAAYLFSEFNRLGILQSQFLTNNNELLSTRRLPENAEAARQFEAALAHTDVLIGSALKAEPGNPNALLAKTLRWGLHADYLALIQKREFAALKEVRVGRETAQQLLASHGDYYDAYIATGVENYLLSQKPAPLRWILKATGAETDRETGIAQLRKTAAHGEYLAPYAKVLLAVAALRKGDRQQARELLTWLASHYAGNPLYRTELAKL